MAFSHAGLLLVLGSCVHKSCFLASLCYVCFTLPSCTPQFSSVRLLFYSLSSSLLFIPTDVYDAHG